MIPAAERRPAHGTLSRLLARLEPEYVGLRELPFTVLYLVVIVLLVTTPEAPHHSRIAVTVVPVVAIQVVASLGRWGRWPRPLQYLPPIAQMICLVGLDWASGSFPSYFTVLLFLPVVSLALQPDSIGVAVGTAGTAVMTLGAVWVQPGPVAEDQVGLHQALVVTCCALLVGLGVYAVTQRLRERTEDQFALRPSSRRRCGRWPSSTPD
ncbi:MAG: hypothetical protein L0H41_00595 [Microlunatus sp.]|nr:hypothetical protein [Microlunatus sp.]MDN5769937.1 hypothetical protein [Microlunatus sp.]MDN5803590.1 hypothetical protein [Microlunatus sp.]